LAWLCTKVSYETNGKKSPRHPPPRKKGKREASSSAKTVGDQASEHTAKRTQLLAYVREATHTFAPQENPKGRFMLWDPHNKKSCVIMLYERSLYCGKESDAVE